MQVEKKYGNGPMNALLLSVFPLVLAFAELLPSHSAAAQAITPENRQAAAAEQETKQDVEGALATMTQSGSTNTRGYTVVIRDDGSATAEIGSAVALRSEPRDRSSFPLEQSIQKPCGACLQRLGMSAKSRPEAARNRSPLERVLKLPMRARPVEICNASDKHRASIRRHFKHLKP